MHSIFGNINKPFLVLCERKMVPIKRRLNNKPIGVTCKALKDLEKKMTNRDVAAKYGLPKSILSTWRKISTNWQLLWKRKECSVSAGRNLHPCTEHGKLISPWADWWFKTECCNQLFHKKKKKKKASQSYLCQFLLFISNFSKTQTLDRSNFFKVPWEFELSSSIFTRLKFSKKTVNLH